MIHLVDEALRALLVAEAVPQGTEVELDPPTREWAARQTRPTVNLFLYDVREELSRRDVTREIVRGDEDRIVGRPLPPRWIRLSYLLTAWTSTPPDEHRLLAQLLACVISHQALPAEHVPTDLAGLELPIVMQAALPPSQDRSLSDIWSALGGEMKPSIDVQVVAPVRPGDRYKVGERIEHPLDVRVHRLIRHNED